MSANQSLPSWKQALGTQIRDARKKNHMTQRELAKAVSRSRQMIQRYEAGTDVPTVDVLGDIAEALTMSKVSINGYSLTFAKPKPASGIAPEQLGLDLDQEYVYTGATLKIIPSKMSITINTTAPLSAIPVEKSRRSGTT